MHIIINDQLIERLSVHQKNTSFKKIEELVEYVIEEYLSAINEKDNSSDSKSEKEILNERLRNLGYL